MDFLRVILLSISLAFTVFSSSEALNFNIGGKDGWSLQASKKYDGWANKMRFQVNDTLTFKYKKETDSVVAVKKNDYEKCNAENPIEKMDGGDSVLKLDRSGPFYFITGNKSNCDQGQKLTIVVLAVRNKGPPQQSMPSPTPAPETSSPVPSPESEVPSPSPSSDSPADSPPPESSGPASAPGPAAFGPMSPGNSPSDMSPAKSFAPAISPVMMVTAVLSVTVAAFIAFN